MSGSRAVIWAANGRFRREAHISTKYSSSLEEAWLSCSDGHRWRSRHPESSAGQGPRQVVGLSSSGSFWTPDNVWPLRIVHFPPFVGAGSPDRPSIGSRPVPPFAAAVPARSQRPAPGRMGRDRHWYRGTVRRLCDFDCFGQRCGSQPGSPTPATRSDLVGGQFSPRRSPPPGSWSDRTLLMAGAVRGGG